MKSLWTLAGAEPDFRSDLIRLNFGIARRRTTSKVARQSLSACSVGSARRLYNFTVVFASARIFRFDVARARSGRPASRSSFSLHPKRCSVFVNQGISARE